tara:strand:- start:834 stop:1106 length:273 start_codon:yes stop_codon:yes gene_type:complete
MSTSKTTKTGPAKSAKRKSAKTKKSTSCSTSGTSCKEKLYVRLCILLLALNFALTGYVVHSVLEIQDELTTDHSSQTATTTTTEETQTPE